MRAKPFLRPEDQMPKQRDLDQIARFAKDLADRGREEEAWALEGRLAEREMYAKRPAPPMPAGKHPDPLEAKFAFVYKVSPPDFREGREVLCVQVTDEFSVTGVVCVISARGTRRISAREVAIARFHALNQVTAYGQTVDRYIVVKE